MNLKLETWNLKRGILTVLAVSGLFILSSSLDAVESPLYIPFQGQVTNQAGSVVTDGQYSVIFNLYDQAVGGQPVWSERHVKIGVTRGMINVFLGSISPLASVDFSQTKYLGITVDTDNLATTADPEMVPRSLIMSAFHAKNSEKLASHNWSSFMTSNNPSTAFIQATRIDANTISTNQIVAGAVTNDRVANNAITSSKLDAAVVQSLIPVGTILPFAGSTAPPGFLLCNGAEVSRGGAYLSLFNTIGTTYGPGNNVNTFNLPNAQGIVLRGTGSQSINGRTKTGPALGALQEDQIQNITGQTPVGDVASGSLLTGAFALGADVAGVTAGGGSTDNLATFDASRVARAGSETRVSSVGVNFIIKY